MPRIPQKVARRLSLGLKQFQPILESAKSRDLNESDTVVIVTDILSEIFGAFDSSKIELMSEDRCLIKNRTENLMRRRRIEEEVEFGVAPRVVDAHR